MRYTPRADDRDDVPIDATMRADAEGVINIATVEGTGNQLLHVLPIPVLRSTVVGETQYQVQRY